MKQQRWLRVYDGNDPNEFPQKWKWNRPTFKDQFGQYWDIEYGANQIGDDLILFDSYGRPFILDDESKLSGEE